MRPVPIAAVAGGLLAVALAGCAPLEQHTDTAVARTGDAAGLALSGDAAAVATTLRSARAAGGYPATLAGLDVEQLPSGNRVEQYTVAGTGFRFCVVSPAGAWVAYDAAAGGIVADGADGGCRFG